MKWRVMEFEDKEFLWLHLIWNLTPKNLLRVSCTASLPYTESFFFLGPHARNPSQFHAAPTNSRTEFFPAGGPSLLFSSLYDNYLPATTTDTWPRANCQNNPRRKILGARTRTNKNFNPHVTSGPGIEREDSTFTTAPSLLPGQHFLPEKCSNLRNGRGYMVPLLSFL